MLLEHDIFISYPHISNMEDSSRQNGWVARFHQDLKVRLSDYLGRDARVWRDNKLPPGAILDDAILNRLRKSAVLLCILSPAYVRSTWCMQELSQFCREASQAGGLVLNDQSRIITAIKTPVPHHPEQLGNSLFCKFYEPSDDKGGAPRDFEQELGGYGHAKYKESVSQIAWTVKTIVEQLDEPECTTNVRAVYLAETTSDLDGYRNKLKDELEA